MFKKENKNMSEKKFIPFDMENASEYTINNDDNFSITIANSGDGLLDIYGEIQIDKVNIKDSDLEMLNKYLDKLHEIKKKMEIKLGKVNE